MMIRQFKPLFGSCGVLILSLYCRGVWAADAAVNAASTYVHIVRSVFARYRQEAIKTDP